MRDTPLARAEAHHPAITEQALDGLPPPHPRYRVPGGQGQDGAPRPRAPDEPGESPAPGGFSSRSRSAAKGHQVALMDQEQRLVQGRERKAFVDFMS